MRLIKNSKLKIQNLIITPLIFIIISCSPTTEVSKGELSGIVNLEGENDHSGITISLYDLAYLDTTITRINQQYPQIGVIITQHTEFDHRLQSPIKTTTTEADGSFQIKNIPTGTYNFVAQKESFGFRYLYEISISNGDNELSEVRSQSHLNNEISRACWPPELACTERSRSKGRRDISSKSPSEQDHYSFFILHSSLQTRSDISLYPEIHVSGDYIQDVTVAPYHHLVIDDDTNFVPGTSLTIMPDAVVRINPGCDLKIFGNFSAQGEQDHMFWITSNHGFDVRGEGRSEKGKRKSVILPANPKLSEGWSDPAQTDCIEGSHFPSHISHFLDGEIELYNSMELANSASVANDLITWGKWDRGNYCLLVGSHFYGDYLDFSAMNKGLIITALENFSVSNVNLSSFTDYNSSLGISFDLVENVNFQNSIVVGLNTGLYIKDTKFMSINNNFLRSNFKSIKLLGAPGEIKNNEFSSTFFDMETTYLNSNTVYISDSLYINFNSFSGRNCFHFDYEPTYSRDLCFKINNNNFFNNYDFFNVNYYPHDFFVDCTFNYFNGLNDSELIMLRITDYDNFGNPFLIKIEPYYSNEIPNCGIQ